MPLHDYIKQIYKNVNDSLYIIRFISYLINMRYNRVVFSVNGVKVEPLNTGVLKDSKSNKRFNSFAEFYTYASGIKVIKTDIDILSKINVTNKYSVMRIICNAKEDDILSFFDQKYRTYLMYCDIKNRITKYVPNSINGPIKLQWKGIMFTLECNKISCINDNTFELNILGDYENGLVINQLYYCTNDGYQLINML